MRTRNLFITAAMLIAVSPHMAAAQCVRGWEAVGELPGFLVRSPYSWFPASSSVTLWDPDGDGPLSEFPVVFNERAGNLPNQTPGRWNGEHWVRLGSGIRSSDTAELRAVRGGPLYAINCRGLF